MKILKTTLLALVFLASTASYLEGATAKEDLDDLDDVPAWARTPFSGDSELFAAIRNKPLSDIKKIVEANPNVLLEKDPGNGATPLIFAVAQMRPLVVEYILQSNLVQQFINIQNKDGETALCKAAAGLRYNRDTIPNKKIELIFERIVNILVAADADLSIKCKQLSTDNIDEGLEKIVKEAVENYKQGITSELQQHIGTGKVGPHDIVNQFLYGQTPEQAAAEKEDTEKRAQALQQEKSTEQPSSQSASVSTGAKSLSEESAEKPD